MFFPPKKPVPIIHDQTLDEEIFRGLKKFKELRAWRSIHVRKVTPTLISNEIVSVQPMSLPTGLLFWLDFNYSGSNTKEEPE